MSYKKGINKILEILREEAPKGHDVTLLARQSDEEFFELSESIVCVEDIERGKTAKDISTIYLRFAGDEVIETKAFPDKTIQKGDIISVIGYYNGLWYSAKGGIMPIITKAQDVASFNLARCYRMGAITGLSKLEISTKYPRTCSIHPLGNTGLYYQITEYIKPPCPINDLGEIDTKGSMQIIKTSKFADIEDDTEDYIDPDCAEGRTGEINENEE